MENKTLQDVLIEKGVVASHAELRYLIARHAIKVDGRILLSGDIPVNCPDENGLGMTVHKGKMKYSI